MHNIYFWEEIKDQLTQDELCSFEARWIVLHKQFQDVLATDQMQIKDLIILEILIKNGGELNALDINNKTILDVAKSYSDLTDVKALEFDKEIIDLLRKHGGKTAEELKAEGK